MLQKCCILKKIYDVYTSCIFSNCSVFENGCIHINAKKRGKEKPSLRRNMIACYFLISAHKFLKAVYPRDCTNYLSEVIK